MEKIFEAIVNWSGIFGYLMVLLTALSGLKVIKVKFKVHKLMGITAAVIISLHTLYMMYNFFL
jgi:DMSO/TMAO reductase YedYZ heme-binding membrane subunit